MRAEAVHDRFYTVLRVHGGDAILTDNWHTSEVLDHARKNFEGYTFAMRTLEAWGAMIEDDHRAYYTAGGTGLGDGPGAGRGQEAASARHRLTTARVRGGDPGSGKK